NYIDTNTTGLKVNDSVNIISEAINDLKDIRRSMGSENILSNGLIQALEFEAEQLRKSGIYTVSFSATGNLVFMDGNIDLIVFRIIQEILNNIIKHAAATAIDIHLHYNDILLTIEINDNGKGFFTEEVQPGTGLQNIKKRTTMLKGNLSIKSAIDMGTQIKIEIPLYENNTAV
ncbi:MAG: ATP-binding protein, partial [Ferruginibacter sp.]